MNNTHRLIAASVGAIVLVGVAVTPAMAAAGTGALSFAPQSGQFQFGVGNDADLLQITPGGACPAGSDFYLDAFSLPGLEDTVLESGAPMTVNGIVVRDSNTPILQVPQHGATFQDPGIQNIVKTILPAGTTDEQLSPQDAARPAGTKIAEGDFSILSVCLDPNGAITGQSDIAAVHLQAATRAPKPSGWPGDRPYDNLQWSWSFGTPGGEATPTSVALTASPAGSATAGTTVNLAVTVTPPAAAGSVEFFDGATSLGAKAVTAGAASLSTNTLAVGGHTLKAVFTPDDTAAYTGSTTALSYQITQEGGGGGQSGTVPLQTTVPSTGTGALTLTVDATGTVALPEASRVGDDFVTEQAGVALVTVTDNRTGDTLGWNVNGKVSDTFVGDNAEHSFPGTALGWTPQVLSQSQGQGVTAGTAIAPGSTPGLIGAGATLAAAPEGSGIGTAKLGADLGLQFPATTPGDTYHATVTITAI
nr:hypothetical protein GCM10020063_007910 [Dactylosporangium thailandense]